MRRAGTIAAALLGQCLLLAPGGARAEPAAVLPLPDFSGQAGAPAAPGAGAEAAREAAREAAGEAIRKEIKDAVKAEARPDARPETRSDARPEARPPYLAMRELEQLQDRIAVGDTLAAAAHSKAIARAAALFAAAKPAAWADNRNARALVLYLFSGGNSGAVARSIPRAALPKAFAELYEGALAYGLGDDTRARELLGAIDPKGLPAALGGHLALVQAGLATDSAKAIERLDLARLLVPGTLVEEAALRKEIGLIDGETGDLAKFSLLARRYAAAFPRSVYRANFKQLVRRAALAAAAAEGKGARLTVIVEALDARERRHLLLAVARDALAAGRMAMAATAAAQVLGDGATGATGPAGGRRGEAAAPDAERDRARDRARAHVYLGAATIAGAGHEAARTSLAAAAGAGLDGGDEALRLAALSVADTIEDPAFAAPPSRGGVEADAVRDGERALGEAEAAMKASGR